ncbi:MAG: NMD3-related protein [Candidatus Woesearchaeota archaeon]|nr:NMD3-related protein [Candidatus Woesearchaeota archaeon]
MNENYYEGVLQLRNPTEEIISFVKAQINREKSERIFVAKAVDVEKGVDLYLSNNGFLISLGKRLKKHFRGELLITTRLFTMDRLTSKEVHRVSVKFTPAAIKKGDIITYKGEKVEIMGTGKKISAKNIKTGKKMMLDFGKL